MSQNMTLEEPLGATSLNYLFCTWQKFYNASYRPIFWKTQDVQLNLQVRIIYTGFQIVVL